MWLDAESGAHGGFTICIIAVSSWIFHDVPGDHFLSYGGALGSAADIFRSSNR